MDQEDDIFLFTTSWGRIYSTHNDPPVNTLTNYTEINNKVLKAIKENDLNALKILLKSGADPSAKLDDYGRMAFMLAAANGYVEILKFLVKNGADINATSDYNRTALILAARNGHLEVVKILLENGADPNYKRKSDGYTAFTEGCAKQNFKIAVFLLEHGAEDSWMSRGELNAVNERIEEIHEIRSIITAVLFPRDTPIISQIVAEFTDGLENLKKYKERQPKPHVFDKFITLHDIQGKWTNSKNDNITVKGTEVIFFGDTQVYKIEESDDIFTLNDWVLKKSSKIFAWTRKSRNDVFWYRL